MAAPIVNPHKSIYEALDAFGSSDRRPTANGVYLRSCERGLIDQALEERFSSGQHLDAARSLRGLFYWIQQEEGLSSEVQAVARKYLPAAEGGNFRQPEVGGYKARTAFADHNHALINHYRKERAAETGLLDLRGTRIYAEALPELLAELPEVRELIMQTENFSGKAIPDELARAIDRAVVTHGRLHKLHLVPHHGLKTVLLSDKTISLLTGISMEPTADFLTKQAFKRLRDNAPHLTEFYLNTDPTGPAPEPWTRLTLIPKWPENLVKIVINSLGNIKKLPAFPDAIRELDLGLRDLKVLPALPEGLETLKLDWCHKLKKLEKIPSTLIELSVTRCELLHLIEPLPDGLLKFRADNLTRLNQLPEFPDTVQELDIQHVSRRLPPHPLPRDLKAAHFYQCKNFKASREPSPRGLVELSVRFCKSWNRVPALHEGIKEINFTGSPIKEIPRSWPTSLIKMTFSKCRPLDSVGEALPPHLEELYVDETRVTHLPEIPASLRKIDTSFPALLSEEQRQRMQGFVIPY